MEINKLIESKVMLAPMAGITDFVLRSLVREYSKGALLTTEMISSEGLTQVKDTVITKLTEEHHPISYQLSGHKPEMIARCAKYLEQFADCIDINMGCPVNKVVKGQDGSALMKNPELASDIIKAVKDAVNIPVTVKIRLGYTSDSMNYIPFAQKMQESGAELVTLHARTRAQLYSGKANWTHIKLLKENVDIPVFANGDINSVEDAIKCFEQTNADGVAIARGMLGDVTLISRIEHWVKTGEILPKPEISENIKIMIKHLNEEIELRGKTVGMKFVRKFYPYYVNGFKNAAKIREKLITSDDYDEVMNILNMISERELVFN